MTRLIWVLVMALLPFGAASADVMTPERGTQTRSDMLSALRPHLEWNLGAPIEFVVREMSVSGDKGFAAVTAQRPGGIAIDLAKTPMGKRDPDEVDFMDGTSVQALYVLEKGVWVVVLWEIGATDVWFSAPEICAEFRPVISAYCR